MRPLALAIAITGVLAVAMSLGSLPASASVSDYQVTISTPGSHQFVGSTFDVSGTVSPSAAGAKVRLFQRIDGRFRRVATVTLSGDSEYDFVRPATTVGDDVYRVHKPGAGSLGPGKSRTSHVFVTTRFGQHSKTRAQSWVDEHVRYNMSHEHTNAYGTYRQDCSGYVSMAWKLTSSYTTGTLPDVAHRIRKRALGRGDVLLLLSSSGFGHVVLFDKWTDATRTSYVGYEESPVSGAVHRTIPYPYWSGSSGTYAPYRRDGM